MSLAAGETEGIRLSRSDRWTTAIALAAAALSILFAARTFRRVFPEASIQLKVNRVASERIARAFLGRQGVSLEGYRHAGIFYYSDSQKVYLDRSQGLARMSRLTRGPVHLWRWEHRWFKPGQLEEFEVAVAVDGRIVRYLHRISEDARGQTLGEVAARTIAERYLHGVIGRATNDLTFISATSESEPKRRDHAFIWQQKRLDLGEGSLRVRVDVSGGQVTTYNEWVEIPEQWNREYQGLRSRNRAMQSAADLLELLLQAGMLIYLAKRLRERDVPVRLALLVGSVGASLSLLSRLNQFPSAEYYYISTDSYASFIAGFMGSAIAYALLAGVQLALVVASAEPLYRSSFPGQMSMRRILSWRGLRSRSFFMAVLVGLALTPVFIAYQCVYYLAARHFGAWNPVQVPISNLLSSSIPWATVLIGGFFPAVNEEMTFRAFALPFWKRLLRYWPAAFVLSSYQWGFLHSTYPNQPFFIRGAEVGTAGLFTAFIMMRFGIAATLVYHYSLDAFYNALVLLHSGAPYEVLSGGLAAGILLAPLVVALVAYWRTGTFLDDSPLTNASEGSRRAAGARITVVVDPVQRYTPMSRRRMVLAALFTLVFLAALLIPAPRFGAGVQFVMTRTDAIRAADRFPARKKRTPGQYYSNARLDSTVYSDLWSYFLQRLSLPDAEEAYRAGKPLYHWVIRLFLPQHQDTYYIYIDSETARIDEYHHYIPENGPGASLSMSQARQLSIRALREQGYNVSGFAEIYSNTTRRKRRTDYSFTWAARADLRNVGSAEYRVWTAVQGNEVVQCASGWRLPENWTRDYDATRVPNQLLTALAWLAGGALLIGLVIVGSKELRRPGVRWKKAGWVAFFFAALILADTALKLSTFLWDYPTSNPLLEYIITASESRLRIPLFVGLIAWPIAAIATRLYPSFWLIFRTSARAVWRRDAIVAVVVAIAANEGVEHLIRGYNAVLQPWAPVEVPTVPTGINSYLPGGDAFCLALLSTGVAAAVPIALRLTRWLRVRRPHWVAPAVLLITVLLGPTDTHSAPEFYIGWASSILVAGVVFIVAILFLRDNPIAYIAVCLCVASVDPALQYLSQPLPYYRWNGVLLIVLVLLALGWLFGFGSRSRAPAASEVARPEPTAPEPTTMAPTSPERSELAPDELAAVETVEEPTAPG